jgi:internalin A
MVAYDYQVKPRTPPLPFPAYPYKIDWNATSPGPAWLRKLIGDDYFRTAIAVYLNNPNAKLTKADIDSVVNLPALKHFVFDNSRSRLNVGESGFEAIWQLNELDTLQLVGVNISDRTLRNLRNPHRLTTLILSDNDIDDAAMERIGEMVNLDRLWLNGTKITDVGIAHIQALKGLRQLYLSDTALTDAGLKYLADLKLLVDFMIDNTLVTNAGINKAQLKQNTLTATTGN